MHVAYDPGWPQQFEIIAAQLRRLGNRDWLIEHIGSTALPGMMAKRGWAWADGGDLQCLQPPTGYGALFRLTLPKASSPRAPTVDIAAATDSGSASEKSLPTSSGASADRRTIRWH